MSRARRSHRRAGFSLIELLLNLAIVAALMGIASGLYGDYMLMVQGTKARYDLDILRGSIQRFEQARGLFSGSRLGPLLGGYLLEIPIDPWGNDYFVDGNLGVTGTLGGDGKVEGDLDDADIAVHYNPYLIPVRARYLGGFGVPKPGSRLEIHTRKVFGVVPGMEAVAADDVVLVRDRAEPFIPFGQLGFALDPARTSPQQGVLSLVCCTSPNPNTDPPGAPRLPVRGDDLVNFSPLVLSITEVPSPEGPLAEYPDPYLLGTRPAETTDGGIRLELGS